MGDISQLSHLGFPHANIPSNVTKRASAGVRPELSSPKAMLSSFLPCHPVSLKAWLPLARFHVLWHAQLGT